MQPLQKKCRNIQWLGTVILLVFILHSQISPALHIKFPFTFNSFTMCTLQIAVFRQAISYNLLDRYQSSGENYCLQKGDTTQSSMDFITNLVALAHLPRDDISLALFYATSTYEWVLKKKLLIVNQHVINGILTCYLVRTANFPGCCFRLHKNIIWKSDVKFKILPITYQANM